MLRCIRDLGLLNYIETSQFHKNLITVIVVVGRECSAKVCT